MTTLLLRSTQALPHDARNDYGAGRLNAFAALQLAQQPNRPLPNWFDRWRDEGYLDSRMWVDEATVAAPAKLLMAGVTIALAWSLGALGWQGWCWLGMVLGSCGLFLVRGVYLMDVSQLPFRVIGSSLPDLGSLFQGDLMLNPLTASAVIPIAIGLVSLMKHPVKPFAVGLSLGMTASLFVYALTEPHLTGFESLELARTFLLINSLICWGWARYLTLPWPDFISGILAPFQERTWKKIGQNFRQSLTQRPKQRRSSQQTRRSKPSGPTVSRSPAPFSVANRIKKLKSKR